MAESWFALSNEKFVVQLKLTAKNKIMTKSTQTWLNIWEKMGKWKKIKP